MPNCLAEFHKLYNSVSSDEPSRIKAHPEALKHTGIPSGCRKFRNAEIEIDLNITGFIFIYER
jgi:hypothetical protein